MAPEAMIAVVRHQNNPYLRQMAGCLGEGNVQRLTSSPAICPIPLHLKCKQKQY